MRFLYPLFVIGLILPKWTHGATEREFDPTDAYQQETIEGFSVLVHPEVARHPNEASAMRAELRKQLKAIRKSVPEPALARLTKVRIWVEWAKKKHGAAEFHPSALWLRDHGYNPEKAGCVEISNARNFVLWSQSDQPWMVMHELAHAYHFLVLGHGHVGVADAYRQAIDGALYDSVVHVDGRTRKAYATTNEKEYLAELSEAYFGRNDFYPFTRADLEKHDPVGYRLVVDIWERP